MCGIHLTEETEASNLPLVESRKCFRTSWARPPNASRAREEKWDGLSLPNLLRPSNQPFTSCEKLPDVTGVTGSRCSLLCIVSIPWACHGSVRNKESQLSMKGWSSLISHSALPRTCAESCQSPGTHIQTQQPSLSMLHKGRPSMDNFSSPQPQILTHWAYSNLSSCIYS